MALYLGKDKIAGFSTDSRIGDTLPVGDIVDYDGAEVPANWEVVEWEEENSALGGALIIYEVELAAEGIAYRDKAIACFKDAGVNEDGYKIKRLANPVIYVGEGGTWYSLGGWYNEEEDEYGISMALNNYDTDNLASLILDPKSESEPIWLNVIGDGRPKLSLVDNLISTNGTNEALSANQGRILNDTIGVIRAETLPEPGANWVNTVFRYNGELYVCEEDRKLYTRTTVETGLNLNGARLRVESISAGDFTSLLEASDGKGNSFRVYGGDSQDSKTGLYGLYADCYVNGAYLYQNLHLGDYGDRGEDISVQYLDMPELDLVITTMSEMNGALIAYNVKTNNYIMRKVSKDKKKYFGNYRLYISKLESTQGTIQSGDEFAGSFYDDLGAIGGCDLNYEEGLVWTNSNTLTCQKEGIYRFDTQIYTGTGNYQSIGIIPMVSVWVSINGSSYGSYNYFRYEVGDDKIVNTTIAPLVAPLAVGDTVQIKCKLFSNPTWTDTDTSYHAVAIHGQMAISQVD